MRWGRRLAGKGRQTDLRYYVYVSDAKVDMLFDQIPRPVVRRVAAELKLDLKVFSISLKEEPDDVTRYAKLRVVSEYIENNFEVGSPLEPREFVKGSLPMQWGWVGSPESRVIFFSSVADGVLLGLTGSGHHVIGAAPQARGIVGSIFPGLVEALTADLGRAADDLTESVKFTSMSSAVEIAARDLEGSTNHLDFLARTLLTESASGVAGKAVPFGTIRKQQIRNDYHRVVLASPIYIALARG